MTEVEEIDLKKKYYGLADSPKYIVILHLELYFTAEINWPLACLLCLKPVMIGVDFYEFSGTSYIGQSPTNTDEVEVRTVKVEVPYCLECRRKVKKIFRREKQGVEVVPGALAMSSVAFKFRNPEYAKLFKRANIKIAIKAV